MAHSTSLALCTSHSLLRVPASSSGAGGVIGATRAPPNGGTSSERLAFWRRGRRRSAPSVGTAAEEARDYLATNHLMEMAVTHMQEASDYVRVQETLLG